MTNIVFQYVLVVVLIAGLSYLVYLVKDKGISVKEDYFGITYMLLKSLNDLEATPEKVKKIIRAISEEVQFIELNYKNEDNTLKEEKALILAKEALEALEALDFENKIDDESIRYIIRLCAAALPPTHEEI